MLLRYIFYRYKYKLHVLKCRKKIEWKNLSEYKKKIKHSCYDIYKSYTHLVRYIGFIYWPDGGVWILELSNYIVYWFGYV